MLYPDADKLGAEEYIRLMFLQPLEDGETRRIIRLVETYEEWKAEIIKKISYCNVFANLSTVTLIKGNEMHSGQKDNMLKRAVLGFDFDAKDNPEYKDPKIVTGLLKDRLGLFVHYLVASGNGFHAYVCTETSVDTDRIVSINKRMAEIVGADMKACTSTQVLRVPTTYNLKKEKKPVRVVFSNGVEDKSRFHAYSFEELEKRIRDYEHKNEKHSEHEHNKLVNITKPRKRIKYTGTSCFYCVEKMLFEGAEQGQRNFCLGRIITYLKDIKGYEKDAIKSKALEWNNLCDPPKAETEFILDFENYFRGNYRLLGCNLPNKAQQGILDCYCDKVKCQRKNYFSAASDGNYIEISGVLLGKEKIKNISGNELLLLAILTNEWVSLPELKERLNEVISDISLHKYLEHLEKIKQIEIDFKGKKTFKKNILIKKIEHSSSFGSGNALIFQSSVEKRLNKVISQAEFKTLVYLVYLVQKHECCTHEVLSERLGTNTSHISDYTRHLEKTGIIKINKVTTIKGLTANQYSYIDFIEEEKEELELEREFWGEPPKKWIDEDDWGEVA